MQENERDLLIRIDTKLDLYKSNLDTHIADDNRKFNEIFTRLRTQDKMLGGLAVVNILAVLALGVWMKNVFH